MPGNDINAEIAFRDQLEPVRGRIVALEQIRSADAVAALLFGHPRRQDRHRALLFKTRAIRTGIR